MVALECEEFNKTNEQWNKKKPIKIIKYSPRKQPKTKHKT